LLIQALKLAGTAASGLGSAVVAANNASDNIIVQLKASDNATINVIGRVLEGTKSGFMIGYVSPSILTAVGVALTTGDLLAAVGGGVAILGNPVAGVCAAVGAVYFGWKALNEKERNSILEQVGTLLNIGYELIKSVIDLALRLMKNLLSEDNLKEIKETVSEAAEFVGRHLSDITHSVKDRLSEAGVASLAASGRAVQAAKKASEKVVNTVSTGSGSVTDFFKRRSENEPANTDD